ncbi:MAG: DUF4445 domain-containing protein [Desulfobacterales bacterium]|nr:DUF4445 domain-containing protein [Desulfobacterales bacterium]
MKAKKYQIRLLPGNREFYAQKEKSILEALFEEGIFLRSDCGGRGYCGKCRLKVLGSDHLKFSPPDSSERKIIGQKDLAAGYRLACCLKPNSDLEIEIPKSSLLNSDLIQKAPVDIPLPAKFSPFQPIDRVAANYGLAVDLGTTTIAVYLCHLINGKVIASIFVRNPQALLGIDVMSRISAVSANPSFLTRLQKMAVKAIEWGVLELCRSNRINADNIQRMVVVGNTIMIHLFVGTNPSSIGVFPYQPQFVKEKIFKAAEIGFEFNPSAEVLTLPLVSGFIGSDILGAALVTKMESSPTGSMLVDVGTNGEVLISGRDGFFAASCATGPAFEGAAIRHGMPAVPGAVDAVKIDRKSGRVICSVIRGSKNLPLKASGKASGICGSGVISAVAELRRVGILMENGRFNLKTDSPNFQFDENAMPAFVLVSPEKTQIQQAITLSQKDIRVIQLAKAALGAGIELLCRKAGIKHPTQILLAGAFGNSINKKDAYTIGMLPQIPETKLKLVGNAAGIGAISALYDSAFLDKAKQLRRRIQVLNLADHPDFQETFIAMLPFPKI